ncbi:C-type lectin domain-containing protein [Yunchengibacter salinarum]|uniref:C-type lectin domain-containing protein n=1 Tax=Yunchengibacter salinarum TaxID=3133399 RepID=UPI0035B5D72A
MHAIPRLTSLLIAAFFAVGMALSSGAVGQGVDSTGTAVAKPRGQAVQDPTSGSYFQLFEFYGPQPYSWRHASAMVPGYEYKGVPGQLARIKQADTHYFLMVEFPVLRSAPAWIGLVGECGRGIEFQWVSGEPLSQSPFRAWAAGAREQARTLCDRAPEGTRLPVFYEPSEFGTRWRVTRSNANQRLMLVEFPQQDPESDPDQPDTGADQEKGGEGQGEDRDSGDQSPDSNSAARGAK